MPEIKTEIKISAPPAKVWGILNDFNSWKDWNPTVSQASGSATLGSKPSFTMQCEGPRNGAKFSPTIVESNAPKILRWHVKMIFESLFSNEKVLELKEVPGGTLLIHKEIFGGLMTTLFWSKMSPGISPLLEQMNQALKKKAE